jgi:hypothetical protein
MESRLILSSLKALAQEERLTEDLEYEPKAVAWVISIAEDGRFLGLTSTAVPQGAKGKLLAKMMQIPRRSGRTSGDLADFLVDKSEYVLGILPAGDVTEKRRQRLEPRRRLFLADIERAAVATSNASLKAVAAFLQSSLSAGNVSRYSSNRTTYRTI